jgi:hypothetical protein
MSKNTNVENFIKYVVSECKKHGVKVKEYKRGYIKLTDNIKCAGFFDDNTKPPTLAYAKGREDYLELLVHEFCHMTQWLDKIELWGKASVSLEKMWEWLGNKDKKIVGIRSHIDIARDLELDNEKRSVEMIKKWNLPIDVPTYTKKANAYVLFYNHLKTSRNWSVPGNSPYGNKRILDSMSDKFDMDYDKLSDEIKKMFKEEKI